MRNPGSRINDAWKAMREHQSAHGEAAPQRGMARALGVQAGSYSTLIKEMIKKGRAVRLAYGVVWAVEPGEEPPVNARRNPSVPDPASLRLSDDERDVVECNIGLVWRIVRKVAIGGEDPDELLNVGILGLMRAVQTCDAEKGALSTAAEPHVRQAIRRWRMKNRLVNIPVYLQEKSTKKAKSKRNTAAAEQALKIVPLTEDHAAFECAPLESSEMSEAVTLAMRYGLTPRQSEVLQRRLKGQSHRDIGMAIGVDRRSVGEIESRAIDSLRSQLAKYA